MTEWRDDIENAPRDGSRVMLELETGFKLTATWEPGFMTTDGEDCCCWVATDDSEYPDSWTDGACWEVNEYESMSEQPIAWALPPPPAKEG